MKQLNLPRVLIVEDDARYALQLIKTFKNPSYKAQFEIDVATNVDETSAYVSLNSIDIYIVDLEIPIREENPSDIKNGTNLVRTLIEKTDSGVIILTHLQAGRDAEEFLRLGVDDYIEKGMKPEIIRAKVEALWRRILMATSKSAGQFVHTDRVFKIGPWRFVIGKRVLESDLGGTARLSPTEHAFLKHLCTVEGHSIDRHEFNVSILGRSESDQDRRIDNLVYRIRGKLSDAIYLVSNREGSYKLMNVVEVKSDTQL